MELAEGRVAAVQEAERIKAEEFRRKKELAEAVERENQLRLVRPLTQRYGLG